MSDNFYSPPKANVVHKSPEHQGSPLKAISLCALFDIGTTLVVGIILVMFYSSYLYAQGNSGDEIEAILISLGDYTQPFSILLMMIGYSISLYAGYLCAKMTNYNEYLHGLLLGLVLVVYTWLTTPEDANTSMLEYIVLSLLNIVVVIVGAHWYVKGKAKPLD